MSDDQLAGIFRDAAQDLLPADRADAIVDAVWGLDEATDIHRLIKLLRLH